MKNKDEEDCSRLVIDCRMENEDLIRINTVIHETNQAKICEYLLFHNLYFCISTITTFINYT